MKHLALIGLALGGLVCTSCEETQTVGQGNVEAKRAAALRERQQEEQQMDDEQKTLWNVQQDRLNRDGGAYNSGRTY